MNKKNPRIRKNNKKIKQNKKTYNQNEISDLEEEKWIKQLESQKTNSLLKKMDSIEKVNDSENFW